MTETMQQDSQAETNRLIRAELKASYPGTAFTVRASNGAGITQAVITWGIGYRPTSADFDSYSPETCELAAGPTEADQLPHLVHYGAGNVTANPKYRNIAL